MRAARTEEGIFGKRARRLVASEAASAGVADGRGALDGRELTKLEEATAVLELAIFVAELRGSLAPLGVADADDLPDETLERRRFTAREDGPATGAE